MDKKKKIILLICFCFFNVLLLVCFFKVRSTTMLNILKKEESELLKLDMTMDRYNRKIQSRGKYAVVEKSIKEYLDDYAVSLQDVLKEMDDSTLKFALSYDNYCKDGPLFETSLPALSKGKENFNKKVNSLLEKGQDKSIRENMTKRINDSYYVDLYNDFMLSDKIQATFSKNNELLLNVQEKVNKAYDTSIAILNFLAQNKDSWKAEEGEIRFLNNDLYNQYNNYVSKLSSEKKDK